MRVGPHDGSSALLRRDNKELASSLCPVRTQQEGGCLQAGKKALTRTQPTSTLTSDFQPLELREKNFCCLSTPPPAVSIVFCHGNLG